MNKIPKPKKKSLQSQHMAGEAPGLATKEADTARACLEKPRHGLHKLKISPEPTGFKQLHGD